MALIKFSLGTLTEFDDGLVAKALDAELLRALHDCHSRPELEKARKVTLEVSLVPVYESESRSCAAVNVTFEVRGRTPVRGSRQYTLGVKGRDHMYYSQENPGNYAQGVLPFDGERSASDGAGQHDES